MNLGIFERLSSEGYVRVSEIEPVIFVDNPMNCRKKEGMTEKISYVILTSQSRSSRVLFEQVLTSRAKFKLL